MAGQKYNLRNKDIMKWFSSIASVPMSWKVEIRTYFSGTEDTCTSCTPTIPQPKASLLPDMSVKAAYKILIRHLVNALTSQKSLEKLLCRQDLDWASIYIIPQVVTVESKLRIFQYKVLNDILYLNDRLYKEDTCTSCTPTIPQPKASLLPDMSVKAAYKILIRHLVNALTSQKSLEKLLCRQDLDWASIYIIPQVVTVESKLRIFQYKVLNDILYLNDRLYKMGIVQTPLYSLCKQEKETVIHLLCQCHVTRQLWCSLSG